MSARDNRIWTDDEVNLVASHWNSHGSKWLSKQLGRKEKTIRARAVSLRLGPSEFNKAEGNRMRIAALRARTADRRGITVEVESRFEDDIPQEIRRLAMCARWVC